MYKFKELKAPDLFLLVALLKKIKLNSFKDVLIDNKTLTKLFDNEENTNKEKTNKEKTNKEKTEEEKTQEYLEIGTAFMDIAQVILERIDECEEEVYKLLSSCSNLSVAQVKSLNIDVFIQMIFDYVKKDEFMGFLKRAMLLLGKMK